MRLQNTVRYLFNYEKTVAEFDELLHRYPRTK